MYVSFSLKERDIKTFAWRMLMGPAQIIDGLVYTFTLGCVAAGLSLKVARRMMQSRLNAGLKRKFYGRKPRRNITGFS
jgi:hypothetical protein